jgi:hypothetical protein
MVLILETTDTASIKSKRHNKLPQARIEKSFGDMMLLERLWGQVTLS